MPSDDKPLSDPTGLDADRFRRFYDEAYPLIYAYLYARCGRSRETTRDLTQETFISVVASLRKGGQPQDPVPWAMSIAKRRLVDHYRREGRRRSNISSPPDSDIGSPWTSELEIQLEIAMSRLPPKQRAALVLRHMDGLAVAEVAELLGLTYRATESLLARARFRLAKELDIRRPA